MSTLFDAETVAKIVAVTESETDDILALLQLAGLDPTTDLQHADLADVNFGEADVAGWRLTGADLTNANLSKVKNIHLAVFDRQTTFANTMLPEGVTEIDLV